MEVIKTYAILLLLFGIVGCTKHNYNLSTKEQMGIVDIQIEDGDEDTYFIKQKDSLFMIGGYCLRRIFSENEAYKKMNYNQFLYKIVEGNIYEKTDYIVFSRINSHSSCFCTGL